MIHNGIRNLLSGLLSVGAAIILCSAASGGASASAEGAFSSQSFAQSSDRAITVDFSGLESVSLPYDGTPHLGYAGDFGYDGTPMITYYKDDVQLGGPPSNAGSYKVKIEVPPTDTAYTGSRTIPFTIEKALVTVAAVDEYVYLGDEMPQLTFTATGLAPGEKIVGNPILSCPDFDPYTTGYYEILCSGAKVSSNYELVHSNGYVYVTDTNVVVFNEISALSEVYDGKPHAGYVGELTNYDGPLDVEYRKGTEVLSGAPVNAGEYTVKLSIPESDEDNVGGKTMTFRIERRPVAVTADNKSIYVNEPVPQFSYTVTGLISPDKLITTPVFSCNVNTAQQGEYDIEISGSSAGSNYIVSEHSGVLTVTDKTPVSFEVFEPNNTVYNGKENVGFKGKLSGYPGLTTLEYVYMQGDTVLSGAPVHAGSYTVTISVPTSNTAYVGSRTIAFNIERAPVTIAAEDKYVYIGEDMPQLTYKVTGLVGTEKLIKNPDISCEAYDTLTVGTYKITVSGGIASDDYTVTHRDAVLTVHEKTEVDFSKIKGVNSVYDGEAKEGYTGAPANYKGTLEITYRKGDAVLSAPPVNAGDYSVTLAVPETEPAYTGSRTVNFSITKATVTVAADNKTVFIGQPLPEFTYIVTGLFGEDRLTAAPTMDCTANTDIPGNYEITISGAQASSNYFIKHINGILTVTNKSIIDFNGLSPVNTIYDGTQNVGYTGSISGYTGRLEVTYRQGAEVLAAPPINAGEYTVTVAIPETVVGFTGSRTIVFRIERKELIIRPDDKAIYENAPLPEFTYTVTGLIGKDRLLTEPKGTFLADIRTPGMYPIRASGANAGNNYRIVYIDGVLTVMSRDEVDWSGLVARDTVYTGGAIRGYSGEHGYKGTPVITYREGGVVLEGPPCNVGDYTVTFSVPKSDTMHKGSRTLHFSVLKARITITAEDKTVVVGGTMPRFTYKIDGLVGIDTLLDEPKFRCDADLTKVGTYDIRVYDASAGDNYAITYYTGQLKVVAGDKPEPDVPDKPVDPPKDDPAYGNPTSGKLKGWTEITKEFGKLAVGEKMQVELNGSKLIPASAIRALKESQGIGVFRVDNDRMWIIDGRRITTVSDCNLRVVAASVDKTITDKARGSVGKKLHTDGTGSATEICQRFKTSSAGRFANIYLVNKYTGKLTVVDSVMIDATGMASGLDLAQKGDYLIMIARYSEVRGDVNNDGKVNALDVSMMLKYIIGKGKLTNKYVPDFNGDGSVNAFDCSDLLRYLVSGTTY